jgi:transcriptional regulator with XRE-family HTH domain
MEPSKTRLRVFMRVRKVQEINCSDLPSQLEDARRNADRSLLQICKRLDISPTYWYRLERGEAETINYDLLQKIEQELSCDFGIDFPGSPRHNSKKGSLGMDLSRLQWIKAVTPPAGYPSYWAYTPQEIEGMKKAGFQVINHGATTIFPLGFKGEQTAPLEVGDLIALKQHAKITHIVEVLDEQFFGTDEWSNRYVKIVWWKPDIDWASLPHAKEVLGVDLTYSGGKPLLFDSFESFRNTWKGPDSLKEVQAFVIDKLAGI